ncbi:hypothetical protein LJPFL01_4122 [Lelliottia jeotgali]|nr:hypothetical protein LJPFL01_4122 [Lelliottia jeotgali]
MMSCLRIRAWFSSPIFSPRVISSETGVFFNSVRFIMVWVLKLGVKLELNVVNGMAGSSMPVSGHQLMSVRCLVKEKAQN